MALWYGESWNCGLFITRHQSVLFGRGFLWDLKGHLNLFMIFLGKESEVRQIVLVYILLWDIIQQMHIKILIWNEVIMFLFKNVEVLAIIIRSNPRIKQILPSRLNAAAVRCSSLVSIGTREHVRSPYAVGYAVASKLVMRNR